MHCRTMDTKPTRKSPIDYSKELSKYLLLRWTLLGESCLDCKVPLVENKKEKIIFCVACQRNFIRESELATGKFTLTPPGQPQPSPPKPPEIQIQSESTTTLKMADDDDLDWTPPTPEEMRLFELQQKKSNEISALIGQKLLQGWALIEIPCPNPDCLGSPLMRDPEKRLYCVSCKTYFKNPSEPTLTKHEVAGNGNNTAVRSEPRNKNAELFTKDTQAKNAKENLQQQRSVQSHDVISLGGISTVNGSSVTRMSKSECRDNTQSDRETTTLLTSVTPTAGSRGDKLECRPMNLRHTIDVLFRKINEASQELERIAANDIKRATKVTKFIAVCANTMEALLRLNTNFEHSFNQ